MARPGKMMTRRKLQAIGSALVFGLASPNHAAWACPPPPPPPAQNPGETDEAYKALEALRKADVEEYRKRLGEEQRLLWEKSRLIFVGRVERMKSIELDYSSLPAVLIRPVRWIKGKADSTRFWLRPRGLTDCGPYGGGQAIYGQLGDTFVIFAREAPLTFRGIENSVGRTGAVDPRIVDALSSTAVAERTKD